MPPDNECTVSTPGRQTVEICQDSSWQREASNAFHSELMENIKVLRMSMRMGEVKFPGSDIYLNLKDTFDKNRMINEFKI